MNKLFVYDLEHVDHKLVAMALFPVLNILKLIVTWSAIIALKIIFSQTFCFRVDKRLTSCCSFYSFYDGVYFIRFRHTGWS